MLKKNPLALVLILSGVFFMIFVVVCVITVMSLTSGQAGSSKKMFGKSTSSIGVIELKGVIMESKKTLEQIEWFENNESIKAVVLRINSPGGSVAPSQEIYDGVKRLAQKKPVFASMSSLAASGGYYVALGAKKIYANPGTITGSIGVIMQFADLSKLYQWAKFNPYSIKTGKFKDIGSPNREMNAEEKALLQEMIDNVLGQFRRAVVASRGLTMEKVIELSDGRIFSGEQAKVVKLVDEIGGIDDVVSALSKEVGITGKPNLVYYGKKRKFIEKLFEDIDDDAESSKSGSHLASKMNSLVDLVQGFVFGGSPVNARSAGDYSMEGPLFLMPRF